MIKYAHIPLHLWLMVLIVSVVSFGVPCSASPQNTKALCEVFFDGNSHIQQTIITFVTKATAEYRNIIVLIYPDKKSTGRYFINKRFSFYGLTHCPAIVLNSKTIIYPEPGFNWQRSFKNNISKIINSNHWLFKIFLNSRPFNKDNAAVTLGFCNPDLSHEFSGNIVLLRLCHDEHFREGRCVYTKITKLAEKKIILAKKKYFKSCPLPEQFILHNNRSKSNCIIIGLIYDEKGELATLSQIP